MLCYAWITGCTCLCGVTQRGHGQKLPLTGDGHHLKLIMVKKALFRFRFQWTTLASRSIHMMTSWNGNIFRLLTLCVGNSPVTGEFPSQRQMTLGFDVFFDLRLNEQLSTQSWGWLFQTPSCSLWRHCNDLLLFTRRWLMTDYCVMWKYILSSQTRVQQEEEMTPSAVSI